MEKFWEWMVANNYSTRENTLIIDFLSYDVIEPKKQMLVGYMLEYLDELHYRCNLDIIMAGQPLYNFLERRPFLLLGIHARELFS